MIGEISSNTLLAVLFGPGITRTSGVASRGRGARNGPTTRIEPTPDRVELSRSARHSGAANHPESVEPFAKLDDAQQREVRKLKQRDAEVRRHEAAHKNAAGSNAKGAPSFKFQKGPDGRQYAVGGEVSIDTSEVSGDPAATIRKMQQVRQAALAPANPSGQDRAVAAKAAQLEQKARAELAQKRGDSRSQQGQSQPPYANIGGVNESPRGLLVNLVA